jgi:hypothetical protein
MVTVSRGGCTYIHTYICTYIHTYVHTYICTYIHMYIHTYVHTYIRVEYIFLEMLFLTVVSEGQQRQRIVYNMNHVLTVSLRSVKNVLQICKKISPTKIVPSYIETNICMSHLFFFTSIIQKMTKTVSKKTFSYKYYL